MSSTAVGCLRQNNTTEQVVRAPVAGGAAQNIAPAGARGGVPVVTDDHIGWLTQVSGGTWTFSSVANAGDGVQSRPLAADNPQLVGAADSFLTAEGSTPDDEGVYVSTSAGAPRQLVFAVGASSLAANAIAVGPGRVSWSDDSQPGLPVWSKSLSRGSGSITVGPASLIAPNSTAYGLSLSGPREAFLAPHPGSDAFLNDLVVSNGASATVVRANIDRLAGPVMISGMRVLYQAASEWKLYDIATGSESAPPWLQSASHAVLWGDYIAFQNDDGSVWRRRLSGTAGALAVAPALSAGPDESIGLDSLHMWGDTVAWSYQVCSISGASPCTIVSKYRDARILTGTVTLTDGDRIVGASSDGIIFARQSTDPLKYSYWIVTQGSAEATLITEQLGVNYFRSQYRGVPVVVDSGIAAWVDDTGLPKAAPLPTAAPNRPRFLGNPVAPTSFATTSGPWRGEFVTSAAMTACEATFRSDSMPIRTVPCDAPGMALGDATVSWDGTDGNGTAVSAGNYTWTLTASNQDGQLLSADGSPGAVTGTIAVTSGATSGVPYSAVAPCRLADTRGAIAPACAGSVRLPVGKLTTGTARVKVAGVAGIPSGVSAVAINLTAVNASQSTYLTVWPDGTPKPVSAALSVPNAAALSNFIVVKVGPNGYIDIANGRGSVNVLADLAGYFSN